MRIFYKFLALLSSVEKKRLLFILTLVFMGMLFETLGLGVVISLMTIMLTPNFTESHPNLEPLFSFLHYPSQRQQIVGMMVFITIVYLFKTIFLNYMNQRRNQFVGDIQTRLSKDLFERYLTSPWAFHLHRNSSELVQNIVHEVVIFSGSGLKSMIIFLTDGLIFIGISVAVLVVEPEGGFALIVFLALSMSFFQYFFKNRTKQWGKLRQNLEENRLRYLQQSLNGVKEIKLLGRRRHFSQQFNENNHASVVVSQKLATLLEFPRLFLEFLAIAAMMCLILTMVVRGKPIELIIPTVGFFAVAAFRLMPSASRMLGALQNLRYSIPCFNKLNRELERVSAFNSEETGTVQKNPILFQQAIELRNLSYQYANTKSAVLKGLSLIIEQGSSVGFIGESGAGKSTLIDIILGLLTPERGGVYVDGVDIQKNLRSWQDQIGYVPQTIFLTDDTLKRNVAFGLPDEMIDNAAVDAALKAAQLDKFIQTLPQGLETMVGERGVRLSGGQRQRIGIARALYHNPSVLVLDEATSALDLETENEVMQDINALQGEKTLIIVAHRLSTLKNCHKIYKMEYGEIVDRGSFASVVKVEVDMSLGY